jgi:hypothetical protein
MKKVKLAWLVLKRRKSTKMTLISQILMVFNYHLMLRLAKVSLLFLIKSTLNFNESLLI